MIQNQSQKRFEVHRIVGRYQVDGAITCIPAPRPGIETALVELLIDERIENMVKNRMLLESFPSGSVDPSSTESLVLSI
jgi:hypothetical protein